MQEEEVHSGFFGNVWDWIISCFFTVAIIMFITWLVDFFKRRSLLGKFVIILCFVFIVFLANCIDLIQKQEDANWNKPFQRFYYESVNSRELRELDSMREQGYPEKE